MREETTHTEEIDFKLSNDSTKHLFASIGIHTKRIRLYKLKLNNGKIFDLELGITSSRCSIPTEISLDFFKLFFVKIILATELTRNGAIFYKSVQLMILISD